MEGRERKKTPMVFYPKSYPTQAQNNEVVITLNVSTLPDCKDDKLKMDPYECSSLKTTEEVIHKWLLKQSPSTAF